MDTEYNDDLFPQVSLSERNLNSAISGAYYRDLANNYDDYYTGKKPWPDKPAF